ncbi:serine endopeptidase [Colletotrichum cereale]|nr:serine endopeptidase [Colletotrichum cereale]
MKSLLKQAAVAACLPGLALAAFDGAFVLEFDGSAPLQNAESLIGQTRSSLANSGFDCTITPRFDFTHPLFQGASYNVNCKDNGANQKSLLMALQSMDGILKAWPVTHIPASKPIIGTPSISDDGETSGGFAAYKRRLSRQPSLHIRDEAFVDTLSTHVDTGVSKAHAANVTGSGIRIAVVDTGFDVDTLGLSKTKIGYAHDLTDDDNDVLSSCDSHGTHILGILGAKGDEARFGVIGVAPDATYELYRIMTCEEDGVKNDVVIKAFLEAAGRGVDVISCSFGFSQGFPEAAVATRLFENGTYMTFSAGNSGPGIFTGSNPSAADDVTNVGSTDNSVTPTYTWEGNWTAGGDGGSFRFTPGNPFDFPPNHPLTVWTPNNPPSDDCQLLPDRSTLPANLSDAIVFSQIDQCWKTPNGDPVALTSALGFPYVIYYRRSLNSTSNGTTADSSIKAAATMDFATATRLMEAKQQHGSITVSLISDPSFPNDSVTYQANNLTGLLSSKYSSWGPTLRGGSNPTFLAPGGRILSTFPVKFGSWGVMTGTSMSAPFGAGVAALVKQQHPDYSAGDIQAIMASTARPLKWTDYTGKTSDFLAPVFQQGGGLVDAWKALHTTTLLSASSLSFNDTANRPKALSFSIKNTGGSATTYRLSHVGAASGYVLQKADWYNLTEAEAYPVYADVGIEPSTVTIKPGDSATISVSIVKEPALPDAATLVSHFSGFIEIEAEGSTDDNKLSLPYTGFGAPLTTLRSINMVDSYLSGYNSTSGDETNTIRIKEGRVFTCTLNTTADVPASFPDNIYPAIQLNLFMQTRSLRISTMDAKTRKEVLVNHQGTSADSWGPASSWWYDGTDANKTFLPAGTYFWSVKSLRLNGLVEKKEDWDLFETGNWVLEYAPNSTLPA